MGCDEVRDLLALYAGGESPEGDRQAVEAHVAVCAPCARELDLYREARAGLAGLREGHPPSGTWRALSNGVRAQLFPRRSSRPLRWADGLLRYAAVTMLGVSIGVAAYQMRRRPAPAPAPAAASALVPAAPARPAMATPARPFAERRSPFAVPAAEPQGGFYLPRVESIPAGQEKDF